MMNEEDQLRAACAACKPELVSQILAEYDIPYECMEECLDWAAEMLERGSEKYWQIVLAFVEDGCPHAAANWAIRNNYTRVIEHISFFSAQS